MDPDGGRTGKRNALRLQAVFDRGGLEHKQFAKNEVPDIEVASCDVLKTKKKKKTLVISWSILNGDSTYLIFQRQNSDRHMRRSNFSWFQIC